MVASGRGSVLAKQEVRVSHGFRSRRDTFLAPMWTCGVRPCHGCLVQDDDLADVADDGTGPVGRAPVPGQNPHAGGRNFHDGGPQPVADLTTTFAAASSGGTKYRFPRQETSACPEAVRLSEMVAGYGAGKAARTSPAAIAVVVLLAWRARRWRTS